jgi:hypothetical protein
MSYARPTTTNNYAEYQGLLHGLLIARERRWTPLHIIGDSKLIIQQHQRWTAPKSTALRRLYRRTINLAMEIQVQTWTHHYRAYNKMADRAANDAMDTSKSRQYDVSDLAPAPSIQTHMMSDVNNWFVNNSTTQSDAHCVSTFPAVTRAIARCLAKPAEDCSPASRPSAAGRRRQLHVDLLEAA